MKFDPLFKSENNKLYRISDGKEFALENLNCVNLEMILNDKAVVPSDEKCITLVNLLYEEIDFGGESYNEDALAKLRDYLKLLEENGRYAFIQPSTQKNIGDADSADEYIKAMVHSARRIKDCVSVIGYAIPSVFVEKDKNSDFGNESYSNWFVTEMNVKHGHYVYFIDGNKVHEIEADAKVSNTAFILYKM